MLLHIFINFSTCFDLSTLDHLTQVAIDFDKEHDIHHLEDVKLHHCNNILMFKEYIANHFDDFAHGIKIVKHVLKTAKDVGKFVVSPTVVKVKTIGMGIFKMIKFINWFYKYHKKLYLESKNGHKHQLTDFSNKKFHLKDVKKVKHDYLDSINVTSFG